MREDEEKKDTYNSICTTFLCSAAVYITLWTERLASELICNCNLKKKKKKDNMVYIKEKKIKNLFIRRCTKLYFTFES